MNHEVFIIILNYNGKKDTLECLDSLKKIDYQYNEIVLVENGSSDDSENAIKKEFPYVKLIKIKNNAGFTGGNNIGIRSVLKQKADYILLLNNDTIVDKRFLSEMMKVAESDEKIGIVCPKVYFYSRPKILQYAGLRFDISRGKSVLKGYDEEDIGQFDDIMEMDFCGGTCMLVRREVFEKVGLFDEDYFTYFEDNDLGFRVKKAGYKIMFCPGAKIWHKVSASSGGQENPLKEYYMSRNRVLFMRKNATKGQLAGFLPYLLTELIFSSLILAKNGKFDILKSKIHGAWGGIFI